VAWTQVPERRSAKAVALAAVVAGIEPTLKGAGEVRIYRDLVRVEPAAWNDAPIRRELLGVWRRADG
jgi:hypothetical protein